MTEPIRATVTVEAGCGHEQKIRVHPQCKEAEKQMAEDMKCSDCYDRSQDEPFGSAEETDNE